MYVMGRKIIAVPIGNGEYTTDHYVCIRFIPRESFIKIAWCYKTVDEGYAWCNEMVSRVQGQVDLPYGTDFNAIVKHDKLKRIISTDSTVRNDEVFCTGVFPSMMQHISLAVHFLNCKRLQVLGISDLDDLIWAYLKARFLILR